MTFLLGPFGKALGIVALLLSFGSFAAYVRHEIRQSAINEIVAKEAALNLQTERENNTKIIESLQSQLADAQSRSTTSIKLKEAITNASPSVDPLDAVLDGLRDNPGSGPGTEAPDPGKP